MAASTKSRADAYIERLRGERATGPIGDEEQARAAELTFERVERSLLIPVERLAPNPDNPRQQYEGLEELARSIADRGILQPLLARRAPGRPGQYLVIAGSRRLLAARALLTHEDPQVQARVRALPVLVVEASDDQAFADALAENVARQDLTRQEAMDAMVRLHTQFGWSQSAIARRTGRDLADVGLLLRLALDPELSALVRDDRIAPTTAGKMLRLASPVRAEVVEAVLGGTVRTAREVEEFTARRLREQDRKEDGDPPPTEGENSAPRSAERMGAATVAEAVPSDPPRIASGAAPAEPDLPVDLRSGPASAVRPQAAAPSLRGLARQAMLDAVVQTPEPLIGRWLQVLRSARDCRWRYDELIEQIEAASASKRAPGNE